MGSEEEFCFEEILLFVGEGLEGEGEVRGRGEEVRGEEEDKGSETRHVITSEVGIRE